MSITDEQRRREAQMLLLAEILSQQPQAQSREAAERQRILNAARQQQVPARQPLTDPVQRRAAQQRTIAQSLGPRPQAQPQPQRSGMDTQSREFFERERLLDAGNQRRAEAQRVIAAGSSLGDDDRICRKLNAIVKRSDISVSQVNGAIEIRTRGRMRDEVIRAYLAPRQVSSATARYR